MTPAKKSGTVERVIESGREAEELALEAVRKFLDTVDGAFPDVGREGPRRKIIDSAFKMTEQLVETWTQLAETIPDVIRERRRLRRPRRVGARKATAKKAAKRTTRKIAKRAPAKKAVKRTTRKIAKRAPAKKAAKRTTRKVAKRAPAKKAAKRTTRKVAKRAPAKKAAKRTTRKVAKRAPAKKASA